MIAILRGLEIRGKERKTSQKTGKEYIIVRVEDETGKSTELLDWNVENYNRYERGIIADFQLNLEIGKYINISVRDFSVSE